jgi:hypothetical protein
MFLVSTNCLSQDADIKEKPVSFSASADASMFQLAMTDIGGQSDISTLRYSYFFNTGTHANFKVGNGLRFYTGLALKNIGLIIKNDSATYKYRTYTIGIPLGLKIETGNKQYVIVGGGVDFPFNYKVKSWVNGRKNKVKDNEWFSNKVNPVMPYVNLGYKIKSGLLIKALYYPTNFWNNNFYSNTNANIFALTLGFDINRKNGMEFSIPVPGRKK